MNIVRYTPFRGFENFMSNWHWPQVDNDQQLSGDVQWSPSVDISESDDEFLIKVEIPEVRKEDLNVEVENGMLTVKGERHEETEDMKQHRMERFYGSFERRFSMPDNVREDSINAEQKDGMLYIHLGKTETKQAPRKLDITVN
jgi:HSP20 family protein